jgi:hypothetical protein
MKVIILSLILVSLSLNSCTKKENISITKKQRNYPIDSFKNYSFKISNLDYDFDMKSRKFKISFYKFFDSIKLSKTEENKIGKIFFETFIDTLKNDNFVRDQNKPLIMPNFGDSFYIYHKGFNTSFIKLENGEYKDVKEFSRKDQDIIKFKKNLFKVLNQNPDFKRCLDTLDSVKKYDDRIFM